LPTDPEAEEPEQHPLVVLLSLSQHLEFLSIDSALTLT
jgi:hypothetical protein